MAATRKILIVDDDETTLNILEFFLVKEGYGVVKAMDGEQAMEAMLNAQPLDLAILDILLPYRNGTELLTLFRANDLFKNTPIIMLTKKSSDEDIVKALDAGADDFIVKPFALQRFWRVSNDYSQQAYESFYDSVHHIIAHGDAAEPRRGHCTA